LALIRKEVAENRAAQQYGAVVLAVERSSSMILLVALGFICVALALAASFSYTSRVQASGVVDDGNAGPVAVLFVPVDQLPRVKIGQTVSLRLAGYAPDAAGRMAGAVSGFADPSGAAAPRHPVASVTVALGGAGLPAGAPLRKGTRLDAAIDVERHRLIAWLFRPVMPVFEHID
jgi:hypothetical protein